LIRTFNERPKIPPRLAEDAHPRSERRLVALDNQLRLAELPDLFESAHGIGTRKYASALETFSSHSAPLTRSRVRASDVTSRPGNPESDFTSQAVRSADPRVDLDENPASYYPLCTFPTLRFLRE
jgi:hypothetical protein